MLHKRLPWSKNKTYLYIAFFVYFLSFKFDKNQCLKILGIIKVKFLILSWHFQVQKSLYLTYNLHTIESHEHIKVENCAIWIEFYVHFTQLQFNSKHAILGIGLWQNVIITTTLYENAYNFAFWLMLNLKKSSKSSNIGSST